MRVVPPPKSQNGTMKREGAGLYVIAQSGVFKPRNLNERVFMTRPFIFKINAAELFAEIHLLSQKEKALWITNFCNDLITLKPVLSYSEKLIAETNDLIEKKKMAGSLGGRPKKAEVKQRLSKTKAHPKLEVKEEVKEKEETIEVPTWMPQEEWNDFIQNRIKLKKPMTDLAMKQIIKKLDGMRMVYSPAKVLSRAVTNGWQDLYADDSCKESTIACVTPEWL